MFLECKYLHHYNRLMDKARDRVFLKRPRGYHQHHVVPSSLGGSNDPINLRWLSHREHFVAHLLLMKITEGKDRSKMAFALKRFGGDNQTSRSFALAASLISDALSGDGNPMYGKTLTSEHRQKISGSNHGMFGRECKDVWVEKYGADAANQLDAAMRNKRSVSLRGANNPQYGRPKTDEQRAEQSRKLSGDKHFNFGKPAFNSGMVWANDGNASRMFPSESLPPGWVRGRLPKKVKSTT